MNGIDRYPLAWPDGWKRTASSNRQWAKFNATVQDPSCTYRRKRELSVSDGVTRVLAELSRFGVGDYEVVISSNVMLRQDGLPYSNQKEPADPGVAVYWKKKGQPKVMAVDRYTRVADNLAAIAATLEAMRTIERHGGAEILDRAFTGFTALPAPKPWRAILEVGEHCGLDGATLAYRRLAKLHHPDGGGSHERMTEINRAWAEAQHELGG